MADHILAVGWMRGLSEVPCNAVVLKGCEHLDEWIHRFCINVLLLLRSKIHIWIFIKWIEFLSNVKDFSSQSIFSVYLESVIWISTSWAAAVLQQLKPKVSAATCQFTYKVGGTIFSMYWIFFKSMLRSVVSAFALNLSWAIAAETIFYNDILIT